MTTTADAIKARQRKHWNLVAPGWGVWLEWTRRNFAPLTAWFAHAAGWKPGARVLDIACGAGYPALDAASAVRPGGHVVAVDLSPDMIAVASERAAALGVDGIEFLQMDAEDLSVPDRSFDAVTSAYGLMFCPNPSAAVREAHRVLVPGGRFAVAVWDEPSRNPFLTTVREVAQARFALPDPPPDEPHPFRLASVDAVRSLVEGGGFADARVDSIPMTFECESAGEYSRIFADLVLKSRFASMTPGDVRAFEDAVAEAARPYTVGGRVRVATMTLCASARK